MREVLSHSVSGQIIYNRVLFKNDLSHLEFSFFAGIIELAVISA